MSWSQWKWIASSSRKSNFDIQTRSPRGRKPFAYSQISAQVVTVFLISKPDLHEGGSHSLTVRWVHRLSPFSWYSNQISTREEAIHSDKCTGCHRFLDIQTRSPRGRKPFIQISAQIVTVFVFPSRGRKRSICCSTKSCCSFCLLLFLLLAQSLAYFPEISLNFLQDIGLFVWPLVFCGVFFSG